jgi:hypothetical protein
MASDRTPTVPPYGRQVRTRRWAHDKESGPYLAAQAHEASSRVPCVQASAAARAQRVGALCHSGGGVACAEKRRRSLALAHPRSRACDRVRRQLPRRSRLHHTRTQGPHRRQRARQRRAPAEASAGGACRGRRVVWTCADLREGGACEQQPTSGPRRQPPWSRGMAAGARCARERERRRSESNSAAAGASQCPAISLRCQRIAPLRAQPRAPPRAAHASQPVSACAARRAAWISYGVGFRYSAERRPMTRLCC